MPKAFPIEFRRDVITVARKNEAPIARVAKDFGISEPCLQRWLKLADIEDGSRPGVTQADDAELRGARKRIRLLEQENEILRQLPRICLRRRSQNDVPAVLRVGR